MFVLLFLYFLLLLNICRVNFDFKQPRYYRLFVIYLGKDILKQEESKKIIVQMKQKNDTNHPLSFFSPCNGLILLICCFPYLGEGDHFFRPPPLFL